jgi:4-alpha-glucanotransferase
MNRRTSGILLHLTSLPSPFGIGDLGPEAYEFVDFLEATKQRFWQILPLSPTDPQYDHSPYHSTSAFAFNPLLISPELLRREGLLEEAELDEVRSPLEDRIDFPAVCRAREGLLDRAVRRFRDRGPRKDFRRFCERHAAWLDDYALFTVLRARFEGRPLHAWPDEVKHREPGAMDRARRDFADELERIRILQFLFHRQWTALKEYGADRGIRIIGDMPIYVEYNSADLWTRPDYFLLDEDLKSYVVAGVPPDYFSETGQLWGNPLYRWDALERNDFDWWMRRMEHNLALFDIVRIDHFRGLVAYWEVKASEDTAMNGRWVEAPATAFLEQLAERFPDLPVIAEDLGVITPDVVEIMDRFKLPGMKPILFAFGEDMPTNPYIPHNLVRHCVAYTGTHDNQTARGWFEREAGPGERERLFAYLGREIEAGEVSRELMRLVMMSAADLAIIPIQDLLGLGGEARMNDPSTMKNNWRWRLGGAYDTPEVRRTLLALTETYGRA